MRLDTTSTGAPLWSAPTMGPLGEVLTVSGVPVGSSTTHAWPALAWVAATMAAPRSKVINFMSSSVGLLQTPRPSRFAALQRGLGRNEDQLISARIYHEWTDGFQD